MVERQACAHHSHAVRHIDLGRAIVDVDGLIGEVDDLPFDEGDLQVRYLMVDTRKWLPGKHVLIAVDCVQKVSWSESTVTVSLSREAVRTRPDMTSVAHLLLRHEASVYAHYDSERTEMLPAEVKRGWFAKGRLARNDSGLGYKPL